MSVYIIYTIYTMSVYIIYTMFTMSVYIIYTMYTMSVYIQVICFDKKHLRHYDNKKLQFLEKTIGISL